MARRTDMLALIETDSVEATQDLEYNIQTPVTRSWGAFLLATVEALCLFVVTAGRAGFVLSSIAGAAAGWAKLLHQDIFRIPALLLAIGGSMFNLFLLWRSHRLRNAPAAAWRKKPLTTKARWRIGLVLTLSVSTLMVAGAEIYFHRLFHHSII